MRINLSCFLVVVMSGMTFLGGQARADEEKVALDKLPKSVVDAVKKQFPKADLVSAVQEKDDDEILYEVTVKEDGKNIDVTLKPNGKIEGFEKELTVQDLPKAVTEALEKAYPKSSLKKVEAVYEVEDDEQELEFYEVLVTTAEKKDVEVKVEDDGKILKDKKDDDDKDAKEEKEEREKKDLDKEDKDDDDDKDSKSDKKERDEKGEKSQKSADKEDDDDAKTTFTSDFSAEKEHLTATGRNPFFVLEPGYQLVFEGGNENLTISVLDATKTVDGVETRVVEERESKNGKLVEVSRNFFAISKVTNSVYYFGEEVDIYKDDKVVSHEGAWLSGEKGARFGLAMPGLPLVGAKHQQETAPGEAMDRAEIVSVSEMVKVPAGEFKNCVKVAETTPLEPREREYKVYAPGIGLLRDGGMKLVKYGKAEAPKK